MSFSFTEPQSPPDLPAAQIVTSAKRKRLLRPCRTRFLQHLQQVMPNGHTSHASPQGLRCIKKSVTSEYVTPYRCESGPKLAGT